MLNKVELASFFVGRSLLWTQDLTPVDTRPHSCGVNMILNASTSKKMHISTMTVFLISNLFLGQDVDGSKKKKKIYAESHKMILGEIEHLKPPLFAKRPDYR